MFTYWLAVYVFAFENPNDIEHGKRGFEDEWQDQDEYFHDHENREVDNWILLLTIVHLLSNIWLIINCKKIE